MFMRKSSSDERSSELRRNHEALRQSRIEQFQLKYLKKQKLSMEKQTEYKRKLKERSIKAEIRRNEAIIKREAIYENKKIKTFARRPNSESRSFNGNSSLEQRSSSTPGVFMNFSKNTQEGKYGFGNTITKVAEYITCKKGVNFVNTSVYDKQLSERRLDIGFNRSCRSLNQLESNFSSEDNERKQIVSGALTTVTCKKDESSDTRSMASTPFPKKYKYINRKQSFKLIRKKVSFITPKYEQIFDKPSIKKSIVIETPVTSKGILLKMSALSSRQRNNEHMMYEPGMVLKVILPNKGIKEELLEEEEGHIEPLMTVEAERVFINEATNTEPIKTFYPMNSITTSFKNQDLTQEINCEKLIQTCEIDQINRKLKLAQLHENLIKIESETKLINNKNSEITKKFMNKFQIIKANADGKLTLEESFVDSRTKIITNNLQSAISSIRPIINSQKKNYNCDKECKQFRLINGSVNIRNFDMYKTAVNVAMEDLRL